MDSPEVSMTAYLNAMGVGAGGSLQSMDEIVCSLLRNPK
jgi:hypothetical protein